MLSTPQLANEITGSIVAPGDPDYDEARAVFSPAFDRRPAMVVRAADSADVARVVAYARETGAELAVRGGGHSMAGHSASEGGIVLDVRALDDFELDVEARTAWAGAGLTTGAYTAAAGEHALVTGFGDTGSVGVAGITLSGGLGFLVRKHGLTIDDLLAVEIVTADGERRHVDAEQHPDLFWAVRGGGGNFGVVTRLKFRLHPLPEFTGGILILPATPDVIAGFIAEAESAPEELSAIAGAMTAPPLPFVPSEHHGKLVLMAMVAYAGGPANAERALAPFRALAPALADMVRPMPYAEMFPEEAFRPTVAARTMFLGSVDRKAAETILERLQASTAPVRAVQLRVLGGAMARIPADATAFAHRGSRLMVNVAAMYQDPAELPQHEAWVRDTMDALHDGDAGAYAGFLGDEGEERVRAAYPGATYERLAAVKAQYDPDNLFRLNQNIVPA
jgi:FAD/FMN-containing dehydrogenase